MFDNEPYLLDCTTARKHLGNIGKTKFYSMCRDGVLVRVKIGRRTAVTHASVAAFAMGEL